MKWDTVVRLSRFKGNFVVRAQIFQYTWNRNWPALNCKFHSFTWSILWMWLPMKLPPRYCCRWMSSSWRALSSSLQMAPSAFLAFFSHFSPNLVCLRCLKGAKHSTLESPFFFLALSSIFIMHTSISMNSRCLPLFLLAGAGLWLLCNTVQAVSQLEHRLSHQHLVQLMHSTSRGRLANVLPAACAHKLLSQDAGPSWAYLLVPLGVLQVVHQAPELAEDQAADSHGTKGWTAEALLQVLCGVLHHRPEQRKNSVNKKGVLFFLN